MSIRLTRRAALVSSVAGAAALPSTGSMLQAISQGAFDGKAYDDDYPERMKRTIY
jgi:hypothetical protein